MGRRVWGIVVAVAILACIAPASAARSGPPNVIRVGGPSDPNDSKIAVVGSSRDLAGKRFTVVNDADEIVWQGKLRRAPRTRAASSGPAPWRYAETADLTGIATPGHYRVKVGKLTSDTWDVYDGAAVDLLHSLLDFYPIAADGDEPEPDGSPVHAASHMYDATLVTNDPNDPNMGHHYDLTGGWMDAGDPDKWVFTTAYATWALEVANRIHPDQQLVDTAAVGLRWLLKMHPVGGPFIGQVGNAAHERDAFSFRDPATDDTNPDDDIVSHRPAYETARSDVAGKAAAAIAVAAQAATNGTVRTALTAIALDWYNNGKAWQTAQSDPSCVDQDICTYDDTEWVDDMALAAAELFLLTGTQQYLTDGLSYLDQSVLGAGPDGYSVDPFAAAELCGALGATPAAPPDAVVPACDRLATDAGISAHRAKNTFMNASEFGIATSCRGAADAVIALAHGDRTLAANERDYLLGRNAWGNSFVVGFSDPSTHNPYHWLVEKGAEPTGWLVPGATSAKNFRSFGTGDAPAHGRFDTKALGYADVHTEFEYNEGSVDCQASGALLAAMLAS